MFCAAGRTIIRTDRYADLDWQTPCDAEVVEFLDLQDHGGDPQAGSVPHFRRLLEFSMVRGSPLCVRMRSFECAGLTPLQSPSIKSL